VSQVISVSLTTVTAVAATPPNVTAVAPVKPTPVMVTRVAVLRGPVFGAMLLTFGAAITASDIAAGASGSWSLRAALPAADTSPGMADMVSRSARSPGHVSRSPTATACAATESCW
jgi:hypothetical protein